MTLAVQLQKVLNVSFHVITSFTMQVLGRVGIVHLQQQKDKLHVVIQAVLQDQDWLHTKEKVPATPALY